MFFSPEHPGFPCHTNRLWRPCLYCARMLVVVVRKPYFWGPILFCSGEILGAQRSVRVLDTKPRGLRVRALPASLPCVLEQDPLTNPCLISGSTQEDPSRHNWKNCVLRSKDSKSSKLWLEGVRRKSLAENTTMSSCMETDVNKTADGFKNVFSHHRRMCIRLTALQPFLLWNYNILI